MVDYRRNRIAGGTYFFTVTLRDRRSDVLTRHVSTLRESWRAARTRVPHEVVAAVILPEHLHAVIRMADARSDYPRLWQEIKKGFSQRLATTGVLGPPNRRGEHSLWQRRYWEHTIRDESDLATHVNYVHINPVKHRLVERVVDWPHSTFHRYVQRGDLPRDWAGVVTSEGSFGEAQG